MNDLRELLPLAAKAMGIEGVLTNIIGGSVCIVDKMGNYWRPHRDSGDGAEMEGKLKINVLWLPNGVCSYKGAGVEPMKRIELFSDHPDEGAARKWASLRAAAAIGRAMP